MADSVIQFTQAAEGVDVLLLGDTHGMLDPRIRSLAMDAALILHTGDMGARAVIDELAAGSAPVWAVRGNNDRPARYPDADQDWLAALPECRRIALPGGDLVVTHGHRENPAGRRHLRLRQRYPDAAAVVYGHSHRLGVDVDARPWILNPGAAGRVRTHGGPSCLWLRARAEAWQLEVVRFPLPPCR